MSYSITVANTGATLTVSADETILQAAKSAGLAYPHGCQAGRCGACKSRLIEGEVDMLPHTPFALTGIDKAQGLILACRARPRADCRVMWLGHSREQADQAGGAVTGGVRHEHR